MAWVQSGFRVNSTMILWKLSAKISVQFDHNVGADNLDNWKDA